MMMVLIVSCTSKVMYQDDDDDDDDDDEDEVDYDIDEDDGYDDGAYSFMHLEDDVPRRKLRPCVQTLSASCGNHPYDYARTINMKCILYNSQIYVKRNASTNIF